DATPEHRDLQWTDRTQEPRGSPRAPDARPGPGWSEAAADGRIIAADGPVVRRRPDSGWRSSRPTSDEPPLPVPNSLETDHALPESTSSLLASHANCEPQGERHPNPVGSPG